MLVSGYSLRLHFRDYDVYFGIVSFRIASSSYCIYEPQFMRIYCSNPLLYLIGSTFFSIAWPVWRISFGHATVSLLSINILDQSINILDQLTLVNLTRMGGCPRAPGSFPSHPCRLQTRFSHLQSHFFGSGFHFSDSRFHFSRFIAGF